MSPPLWTAFKALPWQVKIGLWLAPMVPAFVIWATFNQSILSAADAASLRLNYELFTIGLIGFNFCLLYIFALNVEKHPEIWKNATVTRDFWKNLE